MDEADSKGWAQQGTLAAKGGAAPAGGRVATAWRGGGRAGGAWEVDPQLASCLAEIRNLMLGASEHRLGAGSRKPMPETLEDRLLERIKELVCLYGITELVLRYGQNLDTVLQGIVDLLPSALQHPDRAGALIRLTDREYRSRGSAGEQLEVVLEAPILVNGEPVGQLVLGYWLVVENRDEPFLQEERLLLSTVAEHVGLIIGRSQAEQALQAANSQLEAERQALLEANIVLRALMDRLQDEKQAVAELIRVNLDRTIAPILEGLRQDLPPAKRSGVVLLKQCLENLVSPFLGRLRADGPALTPVEQAICVAIRAGLTSKEIAQLRGIAVGTVNRHRENIRRKLGLQNAGKNLAAYLATMDLPASMEKRR